MASEFCGNLGLKGLWQCSLWQKLLVSCLTALNTQELFSIFHEIRFEALRVSERSCLVDAGSGAGRVVLLCAALGWRTIGDPIWGVAGHRSVQIPGDMLRLACANLHSVSCLSHCGIVFAHSATWLETTLGPLALAWARAKNPKLFVATRPGAGSSFWTDIWTARTA